MRILDTIHSSSAAELLLRAIVHNASTRALIRAELDRRAMGLVPERTDTRTRRPAGDHRTLRAAAA
jgi:hypothetical protein